MSRQPPDQPQGAEGKAPEEKIEEEEIGISKDLVFKLPENLEIHPLTGLIAYRFQVGRIISPYFLFDPSLKGKYCYNISIKKNKRGTAWVVRPGGDKTLIVLKGVYTQIRDQSPVIQGYFVSKILRPNIIFNESWKSYDNDLGYSLSILAVSPIPPETPIAEIDIIEPNNQIGKRILLANGKIIEPLSQEDAEE